MSVPTSDSPLVTVFGGSGFIGRYVVRALARRGARIRNAVRRPDLAGHLQPLGTVGQIHSVQANLRYPDTVARALEGAEAAINLVGVLYESGHQSFEAVHVLGAGAIAQAAREAGVARLVHMSSIAADPDSVSAYARTKAGGEERAKAEVPGAVILRPSIVFGPEDNFFNQFAAMARFSPALPLIGGGRSRFQPVYVGDVAKVIARAVEGRVEGGGPYELGGRDIMTFREVLEFVLEATGRRRLLLPLPYPLARLQAAVLQLVPKPPLTIDQVRLLEQDSVVSEAATRAGRTLDGLGIEPKTVQAIVPAYLARFRRTGQYRATAL